MTNKKECPGAAATVQSTNNLVHNQDSTAGEDCKEVRPLNDKVRECFDGIEGSIYYAERLLRAFEEQYFGESVEAFDQDSITQKNFVWSYGFMQAQIWAISNLLFEIRLKCEFVSGDENDPIISAHIRNENQMRSWLGHN